MGCVSEDDLLEYVERRLLPERVAETEAHLRSCESCRRVLAEVVPEAGPPDGELGGRYEVIGTIGAGGMGVVYSARDAKLRRTVALKMLRPGSAGDASQPKMRERLLSEARAMARLSHPNVLPVYDVGELGGDVFLAMELVDGGTLRTWLGQERRSWRDVLEVFLAAARGLGAAHRAGIIHRDFKPDNVLVGSDGRVRVTDFGLASAVASIAATRGGEWEPVRSLAGTALAGSPAYMAPEQMRGEPVDARADVFSYCVALYEGLYGERPFAGDSLAELESAIAREELRKPRRTNGAPAWVHRLLVRGVRAQPGDRFQSLDPIVAALEKHRSGAWLRRGIGAAVTVALVVAGWAAASRVDLPRRLRAPDTLQTAKAAEGHELYLRARIQLRRRNEADTAAAVRLLEQAVALAPDSAIVQAELAFAYSQHVAWFAPDDKVALERAELAQAKALRLNPDLPEVHYAAAGLVEWAIPPRYAHDRAVRELKRALELDPGYAPAHQMLGNIYYHLGLLDSALEEFRKALDLDPTGQNPTRLLAMLSVSRGKYEEGLRLFRQVAPEANSSVWSSELAWTLLYLGRNDEAWHLVDGFLQAHPEDRGGVVTSARAIWFAKAGDAERAEADIRAASAKGQGFVHFHHAAYNIASAYALLGRAGPAVEWLRASADGGWPCYPHFANDPNLEKIRGDPAFVAFMGELKAQWERYRALF